MLIRLIVLVCGLNISANSFGQDMTDYHMHVESKSLIDQMKKACTINNMISCEGLDKEETTIESILSQLDESGFKKGVVISSSYIYGMKGMGDGNTSEKIHAENLWLANQLNKGDERLFGFFGIDPHDQGAIKEIDFWGSRNEFSGLKLHLGASSFDFKSDDQIIGLANIFEAASRNGLAIIVHVRTAYDFDEQIDLFVERILPRAKGVVVQVAHVGGWGSGYDPKTQIILERFAEHVKKSPIITENLSFDLTAVVRSDLTEVQGQSLAKTMREIGIKRFMLGSDFPGGYKPDRAVKLIKERLPLTDLEMKLLLNNEVSYKPR